jgi:hypothetical protein
MPTVPRVSAAGRGLHLDPIITEGCTWMGWRSTSASGCLAVHSSADMGLRICIGRATRDNPVRREFFTYLTAFSNIDIAPDSLSTNV